METYIRKPCLCCECEFWIPYRQYGINWGRCEKGKFAFPDMPKCEEFITNLGEE